MWASLLHIRSGRAGCQLSYQIGIEYSDLGGPTSAVGWPVGGELIPPRTGLDGSTDSRRATSIWRPPAPTGVRGDLRRFENGRFGFPPASEEVAVPSRRQTNFEGGWIRWVDDGDQTLTS